MKTFEQAKSEYHSLIETRAPIEAIEAKAIECASLFIRDEIDREVLRLFTDTPRYISGR